MLQIRFDRGPLNRPTRLANTFVVEGYAARTHSSSDPLRYDHGDEYRDAAELKRIADQLSGLPVTLSHPPGMLKNGAKGRIVGRVDSAWVDGDKAGVRLSITDSAAAKDIEAGTKELSLGYTVRVDERGYQRDSQADHLAIVSTARCGATCSLRTDDSAAGSCGCASQIDQSNRPTETFRMPDATDKDRADELSGENKQLKARVTELEGLIAAGAQAAESDKVKAEKERADAAEAKVSRFDETFLGAVRARTKLEREAGTVMGPEFRMDDMTERQIHEGVVKRLDASTDVKAANDAELKGQYTALISLSAKNTESQKRVAEIIGRTAQDTRKDDSPSYEEIENNRWKKTLSKGRDAAAEGR